MSVYVSTWQMQKKCIIMFWTEDHLHAICKFVVTLWPLHYKSTQYKVFCTYQVSVACPVKLSTSWLLWDVPACACQGEHPAQAMNQTSCQGHQSQLQFPGSPILGSCHVELPEPWVTLRAAPWLRAAGARRQLFTSILEHDLFCCSCTWVISQASSQHWLGLHLSARKSC